MCVTSFGLQAILSLPKSESFAIEATLLSQALEVGRRRCLVGVWKFRCSVYVSVVLLVLSSGKRVDEICLVILIVCGIILLKVTGLWYYERYCLHCTIGLCT
jgi:uncharacterized membrane protein